MSNLVNCARVLVSAESRKARGLLVWPFASKVTSIWLKPGTSLFWGGPIWIMYSGGTLDFERIRTSTRRAISGDNCPDWAAGTCA